jgi:hypothetical protein
LFGGGGGVGVVRVGEFEEEGSEPEGRVGVVLVGSGDVGIGLEEVEEVEEEAVEGEGVGAAEAEVGGECLCGGELGWGEGELEGGVAGGVEEVGELVAALEGAPAFCVEGDVEHAEGLSA